jgi:MFS family permease
MPSTPFAPKPLQVAAAVIGNALEWYDFIVFGFFAVIIARLFFPTESQYASLLLTTATFGVGFFMRPVGGILLGVYADLSILDQRMRPLGSTMPMQTAANVSGSIMIVPAKPVW